MRIFYFSGTGNAKRVAEWIDDYANSNHNPSEIINIAKMETRSIQPMQGEMLGIISPTHGFNFPPIVLNFVFRFPRTKFRNKIFLINTRAGMKLSKIFLPGLSGLAVILSALVLRLKGYRIIGMRPIDLPSNWISLHPGLKEKVIVSMHQRCKRITETFAEKILNGKKNYRTLLDLPWDLAISPIAIGYYCIGRFAIAKTFYASASCDNCGLCIKQCPVKAISLVNNRPYWSYRCESCMQCMNNCPKRAIETAHGYIIGILILFNVGLITLFYKYLADSGIINLTGESFWITQLRFLVNAVIMFAVMFSSYRILHYLRRYKLFEWLIVYTSFTKFKFWRRYKSSEKYK
jgi:ferredoxin